MNAEQSVEWNVYESDGDTSFRWGYLGEQLVAEWTGVLSLGATRDGDLLWLRADPAASAGLVEKTRRGIATAFLRARRHHQSLHASAVSLEGRALLCLGASGHGKSTLAALMCEQPAVELLGDDVTAVVFAASGAVEVLPSETAVWLERDGAPGKTAIRVAKTARGAAILTRVFCLEWSQDPSAVETHTLHGPDAVSAILPSLLRFDRSATIWAKELEFLEAIISHVPITRVRRGHAVDAGGVATLLVHSLREARACAI